MFQAFELGPFIFWTRLAFVLAGLWLSMEFFLRIAHSANLSLQHFREHGLRYVLAFLLCGRGLAVLQEYRVYLKDPLRIFVVWDGGFSFLGGAIGIGIVLFFVTREHRSTFLQWLDALVPATTFGLVFEWLGAFFSGNAYGRPADVFWAVTYVDAMNVRYAVPIHPVQLYYALFSFFLTFLLLVVRKKAKRVGTETLAGIVLLAIGTYGFEYFRGDFGIPVFATKIDFILLLGLFLSLGTFAAFGSKLSKRVVIGYESALLLIAAGYVFLRPFLDLDTYELRFSQLLAVLSLLAAVVYVVDHRRRYPYL
ncbi:MAG: prolipoprotein diacylglyceryl transferase [Candidatus Peribacteraceae bacterium]|nr:prolipoprotein diacylglyceryl transferase [Candidatus Peribacteraceae bacterium]